MLIDSYDEQPDFFNSIFSFVKNNKLSHAYLIETRNCDNKENIIRNFARTLYSHYSGCDEEFVYSLSEILSSGNYIEIKAENDSSMIKKDQVLSIQQQFMTKSWNDNSRIYVIYDADKLNKQAANSLLKFLEEPEEGIIGILVSNNRYKVLETLRSRCQVLSLKNNSIYYEFENFDFICSFIQTVENKKLESIAYLPIICQNEYFSREKWLSIFTSLQYIYEQAIRKKEKKNFQNDLIEIVSFINEKNEINQLLYKILILSKQIERLEYNLNVNSMLDKFIIDFSGGDSYA